MPSNNKTLSDSQWTADNSTTPQLDNGSIDTTDAGYANPQSPTSKTGVMPQSVTDVSW